MSTNWDEFPSNINESLGEIEKLPFTFNYGNYQVWQAGECICSKELKGNITGKLIGSDLFVTIENKSSDDSIYNHIKKSFSFKEISTNLDRIMWSKDIFNINPQTERHNPDVQSMFFKNKILSKVTFTIHDPNTLVEFYIYNYVDNKIISMNELLYEDNQNKLAW